ncbi:hypothetical protein ASPACDRAFT_22797 [Aspergillus aculeatus ATCC 16872]|uniref:MIT domain-containing protein n=1 Tax=Aspergillus aculeatus (strain ATCC 16872 / CBS 172.66 / WB 5094) TaxID=690307 RepID=A0A1L9X4D9_ASPA1|nr:uncharacterized protein ASPACDRAFT_22797 [Aspergillus aculeatus ATCC 16872]OJK03327.1 hypothetical protein ASPACDRAFT_22797 [Aspergillus aculeatus ATCC 16872]
MTATADIDIATNNDLEENDIREGLGSLNRWSQSTTSSRNSHKPFFTNNDLWGDQMSPSSKVGSNPSRISSAPADHETSCGYHSLRESVHQDLDEHLAFTANEVVSFTSGARTATSPQKDAQVPRTTQPLPSLFQNPWTERRSLDLPVHTDSELSLMKGKAYERRKRGQSQKVMLSKALQKANTAVLLDNAANFEGAMEAYNDACQLLQLVMDRSDGSEDEKLKLQEIRDTYMIRVNELQRMDFPIRNVDSKALPARPRSEESYVEYPSMQENRHTLFKEEDLNRSQHGSDVHLVLEMKETMPSSQPSPRQLLLLPSAIDDDDDDDDEEDEDDDADADDDDDKMATASDHDWINQALELKGKMSQASSRRSDEHIRGLITYNEPTPEAGVGQQSVEPPLSEVPLLGTQGKGVHETTSWLDTIDESGASSPASIRSTSSSLYLRRRTGHQSIYGTEAEFDAALDAAVEAAYDEDLQLLTSSTDHGVAQSPRETVDSGNEQVKEFATEIGEILEIQEPLLTYNEAPLDSFAGPAKGYVADEVEEEERLLEEMTRGYIMDEFEFGVHSKSALPRQPVLSSQLGRSRESIGLAPNHGAVDLKSYSSPQAIGSEPNNCTQPEHSLVASITKPTSGSTVGSSVRARRLSGQHTTELKIETKPHFDARLKTTSIQPPDRLVPPTEAASKDEQFLRNSNSSHKTPGSASGFRSIIQAKRRNVSVSSFTEDMLAHATAGKTQDSGNPWHAKLPSPTRPIGKVPSAPDSLGKSYTGLGPFRTRKISASGTEMPSESPKTPSNNAFFVSEAQKGLTTASLPILPTPTGTSIAANGPPSGGLNLFDTNIHSPTSPGSPNVMATDPPLPLEPCPESFLLRPFWLMRCIYQTMAHPRGGYLSTKLFVPRDVWRVKNVKIKAIEEKVSSCDLLTAALLKLAQVDTYDADAVLEEMQSLESVLDQVQMLLSRKVGSEVGVQGAMAFLRSNLSYDDATNVDNLVSKPSTGPSKSYLTSWRKLRSKNSGFAVASSASASKESSRDFSTSNTVPMTPVPTSQHAKRNISQLQLNGASNYMGALARLCDAVQVLDQIAQQVEDPGLKHSSPTLVGLELSTRHAAEFFGFYICRFALNDIGLMLDKFIKRGSEWVLI